MGTGVSIENIIDFAVPAYLLTCLPAYVIANDEVRYVSSLGTLTQKSLTISEYIDEVNPTVIATFEIGYDAASIYFEDGSHLIVYPGQNLFKQVGRLRPNGTRKTDWYNSTQSSRPSWDISAAQRAVFNNLMTIFVFLKDNVFPYQSYTTTNSVPTTSLATTAQDAVSTATEACALEKFDAEHGWLGTTSKQVCTSTEDQLSVAAGTAAFAACFYGDSLTACGATVTAFYFAMGNAQKRAQECQTSFDRAKLALQVCIDNSSNGGTGGGNDGGGGSNGGGLTFKPTLRCAEWVTVGNTTIGEVTFCLRWTMIP